MSYFFAFFELGGGGVCNSAWTASSNFTGCRDSVSAFCFFSFFGFTNSINQHGPQSSHEPIPSNALATTVLLQSWLKSHRDEKKAGGQ
jgi:hypothetical protein